MATPNPNPFQLKATFTFLVMILALTITSSATSRRILDEEPTTPTVAQKAPDSDNASASSGVAAAPVGAGAATPAGTAGAVIPTSGGAGGAGAVTPADADAVIPASDGAGAASVTAPDSDVAPVSGVAAGVGVAAPAGTAGAATPAGTTGAVIPTFGGAGVVTPADSDVVIPASGGAGAASVTAPAGGAGADHPATAVAGEEDNHIFSFFMHDILGGSNPSAIAVTGIATNPSLSGQVPFAKPNGAVLAVDNGVPVNNGNSGIISNNNIPFLTGLSGTTPNVIQNNGNNIIGGGNGYPALNMAQLGSGVTFQKLMFGTMTVFDDELTEGHELNSGLVGKSQGFYISSSEDGTSQTMAFTVMFHSGSYSDSLSFFGVHRVRVSESHLAIMGGTGKYVNAKGFATVKTFPAANQQTDGVETLLHITVYLAY